MALNEIIRIPCVVYFSIVVFMFVNIAHCVELTFELPDNEKQCFHEFIDTNVQVTLEYQVVAGGNYDVDMELLAPSNRILYKDQRKQYDSHTWKTEARGEYKFCFSNELSTFTHKIVYFDLQVGDEPQLNGAPDNSPDTAMTQLETSAVNIHESLKVIADYQTHHRLRETQGRKFAEDLNERVQLWSIGQSVIILLVGIGQIMVLRSFFTDRKHAMSHT